MALQYDVPQGSILVCDYGLGGFRAPEMVKRRPVVVVSTRKRVSTKLLTVVPLSTTAPAPAFGYHCRITLAQELPGFPERECWVKADMIGTVSFERLDRFRSGRDQYGKRKYLTPHVSPEQLAEIMACLRALFGT